MMVLNCNEEDLAYTLNLSASKDSQVFEYVAWEGGGIPTVRSTQQGNMLRVLKGQFTLALKQWVDLLDL